MSRAICLGLFALLVVGVFGVASADEESGQRPTWEQTIQAIAESEKYGGLRIPEQKGLVPLGPDPDSGLEEFAVEGTGVVPKRHAEKKLLVLTDDFAIVLVLIPGGTFWMGAQKEDEAEPNHDPDAIDFVSPVHEVELSPFFIAKYECTQAQWKAISGGKAPSHFKGARLPVERISWDNCTQVLGGRGLALPTEAQWEYACRAGTTTPCWMGTDEKDLVEAAWYRANSKKTTHPVGEKATNAFGLHDVHGNVWEWCEDSGHDSYEGAPADGRAWAEEKGPGYRVYRGGGWLSSAGTARSATRIRIAPGVGNDSLGCRPARPCVTTD